MQGPWGRKKGAKVSEASLSIWWVCPQLQKPNHSTFTVPKNRWWGGIQRQDPDLQQKVSTDRFGPDAVVLCPRCLQWIFVYSQISGRPLTPCQAEIWAPFPSHSVSQVPLSRSQTTPFSTCCYWTQKERNCPPNFGATPLPPPSSPPPCSSKA